LTACVAVRGQMVQGSPKRHVQPRLHAGTVHGTGAPGSSWMACQCLPRWPNTIRPKLRALPGLPSPSCGERPAHGGHDSASRKATVA
jgi:hypothetical protein